MKDSKREKYIGNIITENANNAENIADRQAKGFGIASDILAILEEIPFGSHRIEAGLCMRDGMLINGILINSEVWYGILKEEWTAMTW